MKYRQNCKNRKNILLPIGFINSEVQLSFLLFPQGKRQFAKKNYLCNGVLLSNKIDFCHKSYASYNYFFLTKDLLLIFQFWGVYQTTIKLKKMAECIRFCITYLFWCQLKMQKVYRKVFR